MKNNEPMRWPSDFPNKHDRQEGWVKPKQRSKVVYGMLGFYSGYHAKQGKTLYPGMYWCGEC
jgi:hypothetical protein